MHCNYIRGFCIAWQLPIIDRMVTDCVQKKGITLIDVLCIVYYKVVCVRKTAHRGTNGAQHYLYLNNAFKKLGFYLKLLIFSL